MTKSWLLKQHARDKHRLRHVGHLADPGTMPPTRVIGLDAEEVMLPLLNWSSHRGLSAFDGVITSSANSMTGR